MSGSGRKEEFGPDEWYSARLLFESVHDPPDPKHSLFEESLIVFQAHEGSLMSKLLELAHGMEHDYDAAAGNRVYRIFREVLEVQDIMTNKGIVDGQEVFYRWWHDPGPRAFKMMRETHEEPWWRDDGERANGGVT